MKKRNRAIGKLDKSEFDRIKAMLAQGFTPKQVKANPTVEISLDTIRKINRMKSFDDYAKSVQAENPRNKSGQLKLAVYTTDKEKCEKHIKEFVRENESKSRLVFALQFRKKDWWGIKAHLTGLGALSLNGIDKMWIDENGELRVKRVVGDME